MASRKKIVKVETKVNIIAYYIIIGLAAFLVYANALSNDFVFDDESVVVGDPTIKSLSNIPSYFTGQEGFHKVIGRYFRPVVSTTYAIDHAIYGLKPFGFHLTNVIIHVINSLLFFYFLLLVFKKEKFENRIYFPVILLAGLLFAVHTIHTEAVSWVSGRTDSLSFTFFIAAFIYYIKYSEVKKNLYFALMLVYYLLSLLSKEMAVTLPVAVILYDVIIRQLNKDELKKKALVYGSLIGMTLLFLLFRYMVLKDIPNRETYFYFYGKDLWTTIVTMLQTIPLYFRLLFVPVGLLYHYSGFMPYVSSLSDFNVLFAIIFIFLCLAAAVYLYKKMPVISFSLLFFFLSLLPVLNIVPTMNFMAERFLYVTSIIVSLAAAALALRYVNKTNKNIIFTVLGVMVVILSYLTVNRNADWKDNNTLFLSAEGKPGTVAYVNIGNIYANSNNIDKAEIYYRKAIDLRDETLLANNNLGKVFFMRDNYDSAFYYINKARLLDTLSPEPIFTLAQLYNKTEMFGNAIEELEKVQKLAPNYMNSLTMLEDLKKKIKDNPLLGMQRRMEMELMTKVKKLESESYKHYSEKNYDKAVEELLQLAEMNPLGAAGYYNNAGICFLDQGKYEEAKVFFENSIKANDSFSTAFNNLGMVYDKLGDKEKAKKNFMLAIEKDPNNMNAKSNLQKIQ